MMFYLSSTVNRILEEKDAHVKTLQKQIDYLLKELDRERRRADKAVDGLLQRSGSAPIISDDSEKEPKIDMPSIVRTLAGVGGDYSPEKPEGPGE